MRLRWLVALSWTSTPSDLPAATASQTSPSPGQPSRSKRFRVPILLGASPLQAPAPGTARPRRRSRDAGWFPSPVRPPKAPAAPVWPRAVLPPPPMMPIRAARMVAARPPKFARLPAGAMPFALPKRVVQHSPLPLKAVLPASPTLAPKAVLPVSAQLPVKAARPGAVWPAGAYLWERLRKAKRTLVSGLPATRSLQKARA